MCKSVDSEYLMIILLFPVCVNVISVTQINQTAINITIQKRALTFLNAQRSQGTVSQGPVTPIDTDVLYLDSVPPNASKIYSIEASGGSVLMLLVRIDSKEAELEVKFKGPVDEMVLNVAYVPSPYIYYVRTNGEVNISMTNSRMDNPVNLRFFVDLSDPLQPDNSKFIPLEGGPAVFHVDLKKGDDVSLNLVSSGLHLDLRAYALCEEWVKNLGWRYMLASHTESSNKTLYFTADLEGRYYIIVKSVKDAGTFSLTSMITSPFWNQKWFWLACITLFISVISSWFVPRIRMFLSLEKAALCCVLSSYFWFITLALFSTLIGVFNYAPSVLRIPLFQLSILFYGLSLGIHVYSSYLGRKKTVAVCPYCGKEVNLKKSNYCCGKQIEKFSEGWYLAPLSFSLLFFIIGSFGFGEISDPMRWGMGGSILGGIVAWLINKNLSGNKSWGILTLGIIFSFLFPFFIKFLIILVFQPHIEVDYPGQVLRIRISPSTLPLGVTIAFVILATGLSYLLMNQLKNLI